MMLDKDTNMTINSLSICLMDNVRYARPFASDEDVREGCRLANADAFVQALPQGYNTRIVPSGLVEIQDCVTSLS